LWITGQRLRKKLQCDEAAKLQILGFVNHTHAAASDRFQDAIMRNRSPFQAGGVGLRCLRAYGFGDDRYGRFIQQAVGSVSVLQQGFNFFKEILISSAGFLEIGTTLRNRHLCRGVIEFLDPLPAFRFHAVLLGPVRE
jgi:hypothetical protein